MSAKRIKKRKPHKGAFAAKPRYWMAMGALAAYTVTGPGKNAVAQEPPVTARESSVLVNPQALFVRRYEIAAGPLGTVLEHFEKVAGVGITAAQPAVLSIQSPGVSGLYTVDQALQKILADTALDYSYSRDGTVKVSLRSGSVSVEVIGSASEISSSLPKYQRLLVDTPQTVGVVSQQTLDQQG